MSCFNLLHIILVFSIVIIIYMYILIYTFNKWQGHFDLKAFVYMTWFNTLCYGLSTEKMYTCIYNVYMYMCPGLGKGLWWYICVCGR